MRTTRFQVSLIFLEEITYPSLFLFLKDSIVLYLQAPKICKMGKGTIRYGGYKVVFKISGERKKQSLKNAHRITLVSNFLLCCFLQQSKK